MRNLSENEFSNFNFLNVNISLTMQIPNLRLYRYVENIAVKGALSQIFYIGLSSFFMKLRKNIQKNI